jgi:acyl dehydratase
MPEDTTMKFTIPQIDDFLKASGDTNPLHSDDEFARRAGFEQRVVPGLLALQVCPLTAISIIQVARSPFGALY